MGRITNTAVRAKKQQQRKRKKEGGREERRSWRYGARTMTIRERVAE
jgi:hypothetical protein